MAHTNSGWPTNIPAGLDALNTADDQLRRMRLDLLERLNEIVVDFTTDPVVPLAEAKAGTRWRHWSEGVIDRGTDAYSNDTARVLISNVVTANARVWYSPLALIVGTTLTEVVARVKRVNSNAAITLQVIKISVNADPPVETALVGTVTSATTGWEDLTSGVLSEVIDGNHIYMAVVTITPDGSTANTAQFLAYKYTVT